MTDKEYIERGEAIEQIRLIYCKDCNSYNGVRCRACEFDDAMSLIGDVPAADVVEVKHGKWNYNPDGMDWGLGAWECSFCGCTNHNLPMEENIKPLLWAGSKYCPNCGAKMDGGAK